MKTSAKRAARLCALLAAAIPCGLAAAPSGAPQSEAAEPAGDAAPIREDRPAPASEPPAAEATDSPEAPPTEQSPEAEAAAPAEPAAAMASDGEESPAGIEPPPAQRNIDENGVDLVFGTFHYSHPLVSIGGPGPQGLHYDRIWTGSGMADSLAGGITFNEQGEPTVTIGGASDDLKGNGSTLYGSEGYYHYTNRDGMTARFELFQSVVTWMPSWRLADIRHPDGTIVTYHYRSGPDGGGGNMIWNRLQSVTSSRGYQLKLNYESDSIDARGPWERLIKVTAINNTIEYCDPLADSCALAGAWPAAHISPLTVIPNVGYEETVTDPAGGVWRYQMRDESHLLGVRRPGMAADDIRIEWAFAQHHFDFDRVAAITRAGRRYVYLPDWQCGTGCPPPPPYVEHMTVEGPLGYRPVYRTQHRRYWYEAQVPPLRYDGAVIAVTDELGRTTSYDHDGFVRPTKITWHEGNHADYLYDARGNIVRETRVAKPGSPLDPVIRNAFYPPTCITALTCNKPTSVVDARNNATDFEYSPSHGGPVFEIGPPVDGVRPHKRYEYDYRHAWVKNSAGALVPSAQPVWVLTATRLCKTGATTAGGCAVPGDEVVTAYEYGPETAPNSLLPRGVVVDSGGLSLRTCLAYDAQGNKISETSPRAGLATCP